MIHVDTLQYEASHGHKPRRPRGAQTATFLNEPALDKLACSPGAFPETPPPFSWTRYLHRVLLHIAARLLHTRPRGHQSLVEWTECATDKQG